MANTPADLTSTPGICLLFKMAAAIGLRHVFPVQTNRTRSIGQASFDCFSPIILAAEEIRKKRHLEWVPISLIACLRHNDHSRQQQLYAKRQQDAASQRFA